MACSCTTVRAAVWEIESAHHILTNQDTELNWLSPEADFIISSRPHLLQGSNQLQKWRYGIRLAAVFVSWGQHTWVTPMPECCLSPVRTRPPALQIRGRGARVGGFVLKEVLTRSESGSGKQRWANSVWTSWPAFCRQNLCFCFLRPEICVLCLAW